MRKFFGTALILGGVLALADFLIWGSLHHGIEGANSHLLLPLFATGNDYPNAISKLCFGLGLFTFGLYLVLLEGEVNRCPLSLIFMLNALFLCFSLLVAFAASNPHPTTPNETVAPAWIGIASAAALLHGVCGLVLLYFAATERPVGKAGLSIGSALYASSVSVAVVVYLSGKAA